MLTELVQYSARLRYGVCDGETPGNCRAVLGISPTSGRPKCFNIEQGYGVVFAVQGLGGSLAVRRTRVVQSCGNISLMKS
jgi:hypothetical protein